LAGIKPITYLGLTILGTIHCHVRVDFHGISRYMLVTDNHPKDISRYNILMIGPPGKAFIYNVEFWREVA